MSLSCFFGWHTPKVIAVADKSEYWRDGSLNILVMYWGLDRHVKLYVLSECKICRAREVYSSHASAFGQFKKYSREKFAPADIGTKKDSVGQPLYWNEVIPGYNLVYDPFTGEEYPRGQNPLENSAKPRPDRFEL